MEREGTFFKNALLSVEDELVGVDLKNFKGYFGKIIPGEKVIGELNDEEKRMIVWIFQMTEKMKEVFENNEHFFLDSKVYALYKNECEIIRIKSEIIVSKFQSSLIERFGGGIRFRIAEDFKVMNCNEVGNLATKKVWKMLHAMFGSDSNEKTIN